MSMKSTSIIAQNLRSKVVLDKSLSNIHRCVDNTETLQQAKSLSRELDEDIECRIKRYSKCLQCSKTNWWLVDDYKKNDINDREEVS
jgi:hypothetical protein